MRAALAILAVALLPAAPASAATVDVMVVGKERILRAPKEVRLKQRTVKVSGRRCRVGARTPLSVLAATRLRLGIRDYARCGRDPRHAGGLYVAKVGREREKGRGGWVYKVGRRAASAGAGDLTGPFGNGRLRAGQRVTWFYCVRATDCQRTLEVRTSPMPGGIVATVRGYDDAGDGVPIEGATVSASGVTGLTATDGRVQMVLPPGTHRVVARKDGLVRSFTERVEVP